MTTSGATTSRARPFAGLFVSVCSRQIFSVTAQEPPRTLNGMDNATRHRRIAHRFLISIPRQHWREASAVLREWAEELEALGAEVAREVELSVGRSPGESLGPGFAPIGRDL